jgi:2-polyprenyl-3-methyl-5-hydroxy-6-metoxy-1,4-benzoquinol methylase
MPRQTQAGRGRRYVAANNDAMKVMTQDVELPAIESLIEGVRLRVQADAPELVPMYDMYAEEARFGRLWLAAELRCMQPGDEVLEIGAGMFLLSCQLRREGIDVVALEPVGEGFSHFHRLQQFVLDYAREHGILPSAILSIPGEELEERGRFALAYSLNVMEHVTDIKQVLERVHAALKPDGVYRFVCPNYAFPYETHFGIPTFFTKNITWRIMRRSIERSSRIADHKGLWASLNWITTARVDRICRRYLHIKPVFDAAIFRSYVDRMLNDPTFQARHSPAIRRVLRAMQILKLSALIRLIPVHFLPVMDCRITRGESVWRCK